MSRSNPKFILITLGEELLLGLRENGHLTYIGEQLRQRGVVMHSNLTISDEGADIESSFNYCWDLADVVITTGGLGPTVDDRTKEAIAQAIGEELVFDESILASIEDRFRTLGRNMTDNNRKQALRPKNSQVLPNPNGTAPGLWLEKDGKLLIMLPGPPFELQPMFEDQVIPLLSERALIGEETPYLQIRTIGVGESALETALQPEFEGREGLHVAYCAHQGQVDVRISVPDIASHQETLFELAERCRKALGNDFLCYGHDSLAQVVVNSLRARKRSLAVGDACTAGLLARELSAAHAAEGIYLGSIVIHRLDGKMSLLNVPEALIQQHSRASEEVALALAAGVSEAFESDYSLSVVGTLPDAGKAADEHEGTLFVGLQTPTSSTSRRVRGIGNRPAIEARAVNGALDFLRHELLAERYTNKKDPNESLRTEMDRILESLG